MTSKACCQLWYGLSNMHDLRHHEKGDRKREGNVERKRETFTGFVNEQNKQMRRAYRAKRHVPATRKAQICRHLDKHIHTFQRSCYLTQRMNFCSFSTDTPTFVGKSCSRNISRVKCTKSSNENDNASNSIVFKSWREKETNPCGVH